MVLLTSSQVSVAISSAIGKPASSSKQTISNTVLTDTRATLVVSFTTALFLSGYAIQQRTVRHLRAAIRPETSPQLFLPDRFRDDTTELDDGTIVMLDEYNRPIRLKAGRVSIGKSDSWNVADGAARLEADDAENRSQGLGAVEITVHETPSQDTDQQQKVMALEEPSAVEEWRPEKEGESQESQAPPQEPQEPQESQKQQQVQAQPQLAPWEIREEDVVEEEPSSDGSDIDGAKPMSRAERRKKIKEDIQKLSQGETPIYYQRRLW